jgi:hypothetical protein
MHPKPESQLELSVAQMGGSRSLTEGFILLASGTETETKDRTWHNSSITVPFFFPDPQPRYCDTTVSRTYKNSYSLKKELP